MATLPAKLQLQILLLLFVSSSAATSSLPLSLDSPEHLHLPSILKHLSFQELSAVAFAANLSAGTPITIFAPSDSSILTCPSCSVSLLLRQHSVPGLYPQRFLSNLSFGTKIETLAPNYCLTITTTTTTISAASSSSERVFVDGAEIIAPDLFNDGTVLIHGVQGFVSHLSPLSCNVEQMASLSFSQQPPPPNRLPAHFFIARLMLKDAILRLGFKGYDVLALALRMKFRELSELRAMTVFALDDGAVFSSGGHAFLSSFWLYVVPNRRITAAELVALPPASVLETMEAGQKLVVTTSGGGGGGGTLAPVKINYVQVSTLDVLHNGRIAVHGLATSFPRTIPQHPHLQHSGVSDVEAEAPVPFPAGMIRSTAQMQFRPDPHGDRGL